MANVLNKKKIDKGIAKTPVATVLVVDDDSLIRHCIKKLLHSANYHVHDFASSEAFIESQEIKEADCLILDIRMQGMSGFDLQTYLSYQGSVVPVIYLTGFADDQHRQLAESLGAFAFFSKPVNATHLLKAVKNAIER